VGHGMIRLSDDLLVADPQNPNNKIVDVDPERYKRSMKLYSKLYRRFGRSKPN
jgi:hypothetical protein